MRSRKSTACFRPCATPTASEPRGPGGRGGSSRDWNFCPVPRGGSGLQSLQVGSQRFVLREQRVPRQRAPGVRGRAAEDRDEVALDAGCDRGIVGLAGRDATVEFS